MISYSQSGQDLFAYEKAAKFGTFLDVGCKDPTFHNNTFALEQAGWRGIAFDIDEKEVNKFRKCRPLTPVFLEDANTADWTEYCGEYTLGPGIGYLSLDIEGTELTVLQNLVKAGFWFRAITCEHNRYLVGDGNRNAIREFLWSAGYTLAMPDVQSMGNEYEDWWVRL